MQNRILQTLVLTLAFSLGGMNLIAQNSIEALTKAEGVLQTPIEKVDRTPVVFQQEENGFALAGILYRPKNRKTGEKLKTIIVDGPMYSVKEQTQSLYAQLLAQAGYATFVFDHSYIGASEGHPRGYEDPEVKCADLRSAVSYLEKQEFVDKAHMGAVGICGSGVYVPHGLRKDTRVRAIASIVPFIMMEDIKTASPEELMKQKAEFERSGEVQRLDLIKDSPGEAYYRNAYRGAAVQAVPTPTWSQLTWHNFHPTASVKELKVPYLVIAGEHAFTTDGARKMYENAPQPKYFHLTKGATHFEMYDMEQYVLENLGELLKFFQKHL